MAEVTFYVKAFIALFVLVNPLEAIPTFLAGTSGANAGMRPAIAKRASLAVGTILLLSAGLGNAILRLFGVSVAAFQVGGGAILFIIAVKLVFSGGSAGFVKTADGPVTLAFAVVPLAIPLMAGPGAITGAILYGTRIHSLAHSAILAAIIVLVSLATYASLRLAGKLAKSVQGTAITIAASVMGLIIAAIAVEMMGHGIALMFGLKMLGDSIG